MIQVCARTHTRDPDAEGLARVRFKHDLRSESGKKKHLDSKCTNRIDNIVNGQMLREAETTDIYR